MRHLPKESRLDSFLNSEHEDSFRYLQLLIQCIVQIHESREVLSLEECERWGSCDQLQKKLHHNLSLADSVLTATKEGQYTYTELFREMFMSLKNMLLQHFAWDLYKGYFDHRVQNRCIKRCHGDLKAPNIYLEPDYVSGEKSVSILDAIDFNPTYCNIDTLSDFAMLVIDIQARTGSSKLAEFLLEKYLKDTRQEDDCSRAVLNYYLFEKAYVGAAISIVYDALPELGWAYLQIAKSRLDCLLKQTVLAL